MLHWICIFTQPQGERLAELSVARYAVETYLPLAKVARRQRGRAAETPYFPRYLFARLDLDVTPLSLVGWAAGVTSVLSFDGRPALVEQRIIDYIRQRLVERNAQRGSSFRRGQPIRVVHGPFKELDGIFDRDASGGERVQVLLQVLGRTLRCELDVHAIAPVVCT